MLNKILEFQEKYQMFEEGDHIVAGLSGGADSVCLLLILKELQKRIGFELLAVHVEHGIRGEESLADELFSRQFCQREAIAFQSFYVDAPAWGAEHKLGLEEAARQLRYQCFFEACKSFGGNKIAVAHHQDDCAETMLFQLSRGSGLRGMCGIPPVRDGIVRPLLCVCREEILSYLEERGQTYCVDSTNEELIYARNRIRSLVLPNLRQVNDQAVEHFCRSARLLEEVCDYLEEEAFQAGRKGLILAYEDADGSVRQTEQSGTDPKKQPVSCRMQKSVFASMHPVLQKQFLHQLLGCMAGSRKDLGSVHIQNLRELFGAQAGKRLSLPYGLEAVSEYEYVQIFKKKSLQGAGEGDELQILIPGEISIGNGQMLVTRILDFDGNCEKIPEKRYTKWFDYDKIKSTVLLRKRRTGDYFVTDRQGNHKKIKSYFIQEKIPRLQRDDIWLLAEEAHILWVVGHRISEAYKVTPKTKRILEVCVIGGVQDE